MMASASASAPAPVAHALEIIPTEDQERSQQQQRQQQDDQQVTESEAILELGLKGSWLRKAQLSHGRLPGIRKVPLPAIGIILLIASLNILVWIVVGIVLVGCVDTS